MSSTADRTESGAPRASVRGARRFRFAVAAGEEALRLDQLVARRVPGLSRGDARALLALGGVYVDRRRVKIASRRLAVGQTVEAWIGGALERARGRANAAEPPALPALVYHDEHVAVVDKPAGLLTAPTPEGDRGSLIDLLERTLLPGSRALVVHRLDRMTSGLLVVARSPLANRALAERFRTHDVEREYLAVVAGRLDQAALVLDAPIGGRRAVTHVARLEAIGAAATLVRARLETGRTHQIRIHLAGLGHPVLGDREHGDAAPRLAPDRGRLALHAAVLAFVHPASGAALRFESPWPADLEAWLAGLRTSSA